MKKRDIIIIIISVVVVIIAGGLLYRYLAPPTKDSTIKVIVPHPVNPNFNQEQLDTLKNDVVDFNQDIDPSGETQSNNSANTNTSPSNPSQGN